MLKNISYYLRYLDILDQSPDIDLNNTINGVKFDSRLVGQGDIFVAVAGEYADGHQFIGSAVKNGAVLVIGTRLVDTAIERFPYVRVANSQAALAKMAAAFYDFPAKKQKMIGVTGTDGKTTTCNLIFNILKTAGYPTGLITTVNAMIGESVLDTGLHVTTPPTTEIQYYLYEMVNHGIEYVILEATSHGLDQHRVDECYFDRAVITNVTHEHLDYHKTFEGYLQSKAKLFTGLIRDGEETAKPDGIAVLNSDDISFKPLSTLQGINFVSYGISEPATYRAADIQYSGRGTDFLVNSGGKILQVNSQFIGDYNVSNCLAAIAAAASLGIPDEVIQAGIASAQPVPGRLETINLGQDFTAIVDFAHTPNSIKCVLQALRMATQGRLICVFGSAGLRDREKRRLMPKYAVKLADFSIFTAEDPRTELLDDILSDMANAAIVEGAVQGIDFVTIPDRGDAIRLAVSTAKPGDLVVALGKGHEQSMCFGHTEYPWDDRQAMRAAIAEILHLQGYLMPELPTSKK